VKIGELGTTIAKAQKLLAANGMEIAMPKIVPFTLAYFLQARAVGKQSLCQLKACNYHAIALGTVIARLRG